MGKTYIDIYNYVDKVSTKLNTLLLVNPDVIITVTPDEPLNGLCGYDTSEDALYIDIRIPFIIPMPKAQYKYLRKLTLILIHEYCHYVDYINMKVKDRKASTLDYVNNSAARAAIEKRTWKNTQRVAEALGEWDKELLKIATSNFTYTTGLTC